MGEAAIGLTKENILIPDTFAFPEFKPLVRQDTEMEHIMNFHLEKESTKLLFLLLLADFAFILVHLYYKMHLVLDSLFSIEMDFGYAEVYQYIKEYWIVVLLFMTAIKRSHIIYFAWSLLFLYLLFDDSLQIHEKFGVYLANYFELHPMFHLRARDFGELIVSMLFGFLLFTFIGASYLFSDHIAKQVSKHLFILVMFVAFFGVLVDMLHIAIPWGDTLWGLIEDGGELLVMSIIVSYVFDLKTDPKDPMGINENV